MCVTPSEPRCAAGTAGFVVAFTARDVRSPVCRRRRLPVLPVHECPGARACCDCVLCPPLVDTAQASSIRLSFIEKCFNTKLGHIHQDSLPIIGTPGLYNPTAGDEW